MRKNNGKLQIKKLSPNVMPNIILITISILSIYPLLLIIAISLSDMTSIYEFGYRLFPKKISFLAYEYVLKNPVRLLRAYGVTTIVSFTGCISSLFITSMLAYVVSRRDFKYRRVLSFLIYFTMLFNGGLVPWYMVITNVLHIKDTIFALIMPYTIVAWYVILLKTFFFGLPTEIIEAAYVDGSSEFNTFIKIVLPMSKPALASVGFLMLLRYWNDWWLSLLFIETSSKQSLQYMLYALMSRIEELARDAQVAGMSSEINFPSEAARMAMAVLAAGPMLFIFPFFQKYFVRGLTIGAVKG